MIELFAILCDADKQTECHDVSRQFSGDTSDGGVTVLQCQARALEEVAKWFHEHPGSYVVRRFGCRRAGQFAKA